MMKNKEIIIKVLISWLTDAMMINDMKITQNALKMGKLMNF